uniref:uncharacterized protein LOC118145117 n=1 Tax=Callithrix jacchus TaxID=9483 RepID=UPI0023DD04EB|nr:uncharacterized protein LOC118145117 [Callithrix jacchus]
MLIKRSYLWQHRGVSVASGWRSGQPRGLEGPGMAMWGLSSSLRSQVWGEEGAGGGHSTYSKEKDSQVQSEATRGPGACGEGVWGHQDRRWSRSGVDISSPSATGTGAVGQGLGTLAKVWGTHWQARWEEEETRQVLGAWGWAHFEPQETAPSLPFLDLKGGFLTWTCGCRDTGASGEGLSADQQREWLFPDERVGKSTQQRKSDTAGGCCMGGRTGCTAGEDPRRCLGAHSHPGGGDAEAWKGLQPISAELGSPARAALLPRPTLMTPPHLSGRHRDPGLSWSAGGKGGSLRHSLGQPVPSAKSLPLSEPH